jgi:hypothetical protein
MTDSDFQGRLVSSIPRFFLLPLSLSSYNMYNLWFVSHEVFSARLRFIFLEAGKEKRKAALPSLLHLFFFLSNFAHSRSLINNDDGNEKQKKNSSELKILSFDNECL